MSEIKYLTINQVIFLNSHQIRVYSPGEQQGIKDYPLLDSAVNRPKTTMFESDLYGTVYEKAAALFEILAKNHAFFNANKRTAFASLYMFLRQNGIKLTVDPKVAEYFTVRVVVQKDPPVSLEEIVTWIKVYSD
jgi:death on curing protein